MNKINIRQLAVILAAITTVVFNILANALPLNGLNTGEISDRFVVYFVPAGYVFLIWFFIFVGLIAYGVYQVRADQRDNPRLAATGWLFILSCVGNIAWLLCWHYEQFYYTLPFMLLLLGCLILIYVRLGIGKVEVSNGERWAVQVTFSIYLGWITVATIANISQLLYYIKWNGWGIEAATWTVIMLVTAALVGLAVAYARRDLAYSLVLVWAFIGIAVKHAAIQNVAVTAWLMAILIGAFALAFVILKLPRKTA